MDAAHRHVLPSAAPPAAARNGEVEIVGSIEDEVVDQDITLDFALGRKLDDFGHGCRPIALDWVDATGRHALYGDDWVGRLRLPFSFTFYGETYDQVFLSDNGYINFLGPDLGNSFPLSIPSEAPPNAAIYALWNDLYLDEGSSIAYATVGAAGARAFVLEYDNVRRSRGDGTRRLRDQDPRGRRDRRPALRQQPGQPG